MNDADGMAEKSNTMGCREMEKRKKSKKSQTPQEIHVCKKIYRGRRKNGYPGMKMGVRIERQKTVKKERRH